MALYNVIRPCVVGKLHYIRPTTQPIEVDDATAAPLVESGKLERYGVVGKTGTILDGILQSLPEVAEVAASMEAIEVDVNRPPRPPTRRPRKPRES